MSTGTYDVAISRQAWILTLKPFDSSLPPRVLPTCPPPITPTFAIFAVEAIGKITASGNRQPHSCVTVRLRWARKYRTPFSTLA
jgi:hypothetical protein